MRYTIENGMFPVVMKAFSKIVPPQSEMSIRVNGRSLEMMAVDKNHKVIAFYCCDMRDADEDMPAVVMDAREFFNVAVKLNALTVIDVSLESKGDGLMLGIARFDMGGGVTMSARVRRSDGSGDVASTDDVYAMYCDDIQVPGFDVDYRFRFRTADMQTAAKTVSDHASTDKNRPVLASMLLTYEAGAKTVRLLSTDRFRAANVGVSLVDGVSEDWCRFLVDAHVMRRVTAAFPKRSVTEFLVQGFRRDGFPSRCMVTCDELPGLSVPFMCEDPEHYPNVEKLFGEKHDSSAIVDAKKLVDALKRVTADDVDLCYAYPQGMVVATLSGDRIPVECETDSGFVGVHINRKYLLDAVRNISKTSVKGLVEIRVNSEKLFKPIAVTDVHGSDLSLIVPMRPGAGRMPSFERAFPNAVAVAKPKAEPVTEPVAEPAAETVAEPVAEPAAEPVTVVADHKPGASDPEPSVAKPDTVAEPATVRPVASGPDIAAGVISAEAHTPVGDPVVFRCKCGAGFAQRGFLVEHIVSEIVNAAIVDTSDVDPVSDAEPEPVEDNETTVDTAESATVAVADPEPVATVVEPEPETTEIPEVPPQTNTDARVVRVADGVIPVGMAAKEFPGFAGFTRRPRGFRNSQGRKIVYVAFNSARCVVAYRAGYERDTTVEREVCEYLSRFGWTLAA